jgi:hypothetical protein
MSDNSDRTSILHEVLILPPYPTKQQQKKNNTPAYYIIHLMLGCIGLSTSATASKSQRMIQWMAYLLLFAPILTLFYSMIFRSLNVLCGITMVLYQASGIVSFHFAIKYNDNSKTKIKMRHDPVFGWLATVYMLGMTAYAAFSIPRQRGWDQLDQDSIWLTIIERCGALVCAFSSLALACVVNSEVSTWIDVHFDPFVELFLTPNSSSSTAATTSAINNTDNNSLMFDEWIHHHHRLLGECTSLSSRLELWKTTYTLVLVACVCIGLIYDLSEFITRPQGWEYLLYLTYWVQLLFPLLYCLFDLSSIHTSYFARIKDISHAVSSSSTLSSSPCFETMRQLSVFLYYYERNPAAFTLFSIRVTRNVSFVSILISFIGVMINFLRQ